MSGQAGSSTCCDGRARALCIAGRYRSTRVPTRQPQRATLVLSGETASGFDAGPVPIALLRSAIESGCLPTGHKYARSMPRRQFRWDSQEPRWAPCPCPHMPDMSWFRGRLATVGSIRCLFLSSARRRGLRCQTLPGAEGVLCSLGKGVPRRSQAHHTRGSFSWCMARTATWRRPLSPLHTDPTTLPTRRSTPIPPDSRGS